MLIKGCWLAPCLNRSTRNTPRRTMITTQATAAASVVSQGKSVAAIHPHTCRCKSMASGGGETTKTGATASAARHKKVRRVKSSPIDLLVWEYTTSLDQEDTFDKLQEAAKHYDVDELNASGLNALQQCALDGNIEGLKLLLSLGADCDKKGRNGWTALHYASSEGYIEIVRLLLRQGADVRIADNNKKIPLDLTDDEDILKLLGRATTLAISGE